MTTPVVVFLIFVACGGTVRTGGDGATGIGGASGGQKAVGNGGTASGSGASGNGSTPGSTGGSSRIDAGHAGGGATATDPGCMSPYAKDEGGTGREGDPCAATGAGPLGTCVLAGLAAGNPGAPLFGHDTCSAPLVCGYLAGKPLAVGMCVTGGWLEEKIEGRCLPQIIISGYASNHRVLPENCPGGFDCVPCWDPIGGVPTGACSDVTDPPTTTPPAALRSCGGYDGGTPGGLCVSATASRSWNLHISYERDDCQDGELCVPQRLVARPGDCFPTCTTPLGHALSAPEYAPGACLPAYVVRDLNPAGLSPLTRDVCAPDELCSPCRDPLNGGTPSGACD